MRVYYFTSLEYALDDLRRRRHKVARLDDLNDPFELLAVELSSPTLRRKYHGVVARVAKKFGVVCFSRRWSNPVLWSHYAEKHRGICLGFDMPDSLPLEMSYTAKRLPTDVTEALTDETRGMEIVQTLLTTKFEGWRYEDEVRAVVNLNLKSPDPENGLFFANFDTDLVLKEIILGTRCDIQRFLTQMCARFSPQQVSHAVERGCGCARSRESAVKSAIAQSTAACAGPAFGGGPARRQPVPPQGAEALAFTGQRTMNTRGTRPGLSPTFYRWADPR